MLKLNCDLGELEGENNDALIMPLIDQANIACGFHAGDKLTMHQTVALAIKHQVTIGAHPSYPDRENFGRLSMKMPADKLIICLHEQISALNIICQTQQSRVCYVKPHGALYNDMMANLSLFETVCQAINSFDNSLPLMIQALPSPSQYQSIALKYGITLYYEAFADRAYQNNGLLVPRNQQGAVLHQQEKVVKQIRQLIHQQQLTSINNQVLNLQVDTLCVHGDNAAALELIHALRALINATG